MRKWNYAFEVPETKKIRLLVHTDCKNEADDQFALVHELMTPKFLIQGIIGGHFNANPQEYGVGHTAKASVEEIHKLLQLMDLEGSYPVFYGAEFPLQDEKTPQVSEGAKAIVQEAMREDPHPLFIGCQGAITDLASAILLEPRICSRMTAIWIGGGEYPKGGFEFNLLQDVAAANVVMKSAMPLWQVPMNVYKQMAVSLTELQCKVRPCGEIGRYLFEQMAAFNLKCADSPHWPHGEVWGLGDSPIVGVLMEELEKTDLYKVQPAPNIRYRDLAYTYDLAHPNRNIRVYRHVDSRMVLEDLYAKLQVNFA